MNVEAQMQNSFKTFSKLNMTVYKTDTISWPTGFIQECKAGLTFENQLR